jgi:endo-1,4-beta-D-glucanase Y
MTGVTAATRRPGPLADAPTNPPSLPPDGRSGGDARAVERRGAGRRVALAVLAALTVAAAIGTLAYAGAAQRNARLANSASNLRATARADARGFLHRYVAPDGRVVRRDQGGDTVSEGQGYALLLSLAIGDRREFATVWRWTAGHLLEPDDLLAYHWQDGRVVSAEPATDADLDTAWALVEAGHTFGRAAYRAEGLDIASSILASETDVVAGRLELVAGPWARSDPAVLNPSYLAPEAFNALGQASGDARWTELAVDTTQLLTGLMVSSGEGHRLVQLPANWVQLSADGSAEPVGAPSGAGSPAYGLDAERVPVWLAASCSRADRSLAASISPILSRAPGQGAHLAYTLVGRSVDRQINSIGLVATAASARDRNASDALLAAADRQSERVPTYYGNAWVALGRILLDTQLLSSCPSATR